MCGIYGHLNPRGADPALIERMAVCLDHRGPDGYGVYHHDTLSFGAGRLAIIDLVAPSGPIFNEDRRVAVVFNGEIYNYRALRAQLETLGHHFATHTDTEVIVHGYEAWGTGVIAKLHGMFALCLWDGERLLLARDRLGKKPLYYTRIGDEFLFASEIKALFERPGLRRAVNPDALICYLTMGHVPPPQTMFAGIEKLAPGEMVLVDQHTMRKERYWQPVVDTTQPMDYADSVQQVRALLTEAVEKRLMSDVPIGAFLSGGIDSTAVVALMSRAMGQPVQTFTVGFDFEGDARNEAKFNVDARYATMAAQRLGANHHAITLKQDESLCQLFPHLIYAMDEPVMQPNIVQTAYMAALARVNGVPVLLTGDGSDELFQGYTFFRADYTVDRYLRIPGLLRQTVLTPLLERSSHKRLRRLAERSRETNSVRRYLSWYDMMKVDGLGGVLCEPANQAYQTVSAMLDPYLSYPRTDYFADRMAYTRMRLWLAEESNMRVDKISMAMSVEARAPFLDHQLVELALRMPIQHKLRNGDFKTVLKDAVADLVPPEILKRPKWGFAPPSSDWLRTVLKPLVDTYLSPDYVASAGFFRPEVVARMVDDHMSKRAYELWSLWMLLVFHLWYALYIDQTLQLHAKITPSTLVRQPVH
jgi:asparagine synthase (glutamine-hydrolysing)